MRRKVAIFTSNPFRQKIILNKAKQHKQIVYGARSIQAQLGILSRQTQDWDVFTSNPKTHAQETEKELDKQIGFDYYYTKPGVHKGTYKVKGKGFDLKKETIDDEGIVDYTSMPKPAPKFVILNGIRYRKLNEEIKAKKKAVKDPAYKFRKEKDQGDLNRIKTIQRAEIIKRRKFPKVK